MTTEPAWKRPKLEGKRFAFTGTLSFGKKDVVTGIIKGEGGEVQDNVTADVDYLLVGMSRSGSPSSAEQKVQKLNAKGASIATIDEAQFIQLLRPTRDEAIAMLRAGDEGAGRWQRLVVRWNQGQPGANPIDLSELQWSGAQLIALRLQAASLDRSDFSQARIFNCHFGAIRDVNFAGAELTQTQITEAFDCNFRGASLNNVGMNAIRCSFDGVQATNVGFSKLIDSTAIGAKLKGLGLSFGQYLQSDFTKASLEGANGPYCTIDGLVFRDVNLRSANFYQSTFTNCDFTGADLSVSRFEDGKLSGSKFGGAKFDKAELSRSMWSGCDLSGASLRDARVADADFRGAILTGADFTGADTLGAQFDDLSACEAIGLNLNTRAASSLGPHFDAFEAAILEVDRVEIHIDLEHEGLLVTLQFGTWSKGRNATSYENCSTTGKNFSRPGPSGTPRHALVALVNRWTPAVLHPQSVTVKAKGCSIPGRELKVLARAAWYEVFGQAPPSDDDMKKLKADDRAKALSARDEMREALLLGDAGAEKFRALYEKHAGNVASLETIDLSGHAFSAMKWTGLDFSKAKFESCRFHQVWMIEGTYSHANFRNVIVTESLLYRSYFKGADFSGADLRGANIRVAYLCEANFSHADLTGAQLCYSTLSGADFSTAKIESVDWTEAIFDETTRFPPDWPLDERMVWKGKGNDPRIAEKLAAAAAAGPLDVAQFIDRLKDRVDADRFKKALSMLKADRFRLFAEHDDSHVVGVVKSQTDKELVYACRLASDGAFTCCTQNLKPCGGLRGALCKHLLVLLVGLVKGESLDPTKTDAWVEASAYHAPTLDKERMSEIFLKYKGAEAGDIDWRPTETLPEDYYAY